MNRWSATLLGGLIGAGLALLLAPVPGRETRRRLRQNLDEWQDRTSDRLHQGRMRVTELVQSSQDVVESATTKAQSAVSDLAERTRRASGQASKAAQQPIEELGEQAEHLRPESGT